MRNRYHCLKSALMLVLLAIFLAQATFAAESGTIRGRVFDKTTKDGLPGANIQIKGTGLGVSTDLDGKFTLRNVPAGSQTLTVSYVGYEKMTIQVTVADGQVVERDLAMSVQAVQGETIVVTGQARGQMSAINQQLASNSIINVVSADKMKELPDANLAESIGRLPGISLQRNAGEAYAVVVRGLSPKYNEITLEGIPMTSTNYYDRSVDLSLLSDDVVRSVEVSKTLRPDLDADALGGTVNLTLRSADPGFHFNVLSQGAYNRLRDTYGNYKITGSMSNRYLDDRFGVLLQGNVERKQLPSDQFAAGYQSPQYNSQAKEFFVNTQNVTLTDLNQVRNRYGASAILDYTSDAVDLKFFMVYDQKRDSVKQRTDESSFTDNSFYYNIYADQTKTEQTTSSLSALFKPWGTELPVSFSYTRGTANTPNAMQFNFIQTNIPPIAPNQIIYGAPQSLASLQGVMDPTSVNSTLNNMLITNTHLTDESFDGKIDWKVPFRLSDFLSGKLSAGGKVHGVTRTSDQNQVHIAILFGGGAGNRLDLINTFAFLHGQNVSLQAGIPAAPFVDPNYSRINILGYPIGPGFDINKLIDMQNYYYFTLQNQPKYWQDGPQDYDHNYRDIEHSEAGYVMGEFNLGSDLTIVPGVRYQDETTDISAYHILLNGSNQNGLYGQAPKLVESRRNTPDWFPSVNMKYRATENIQVIGAAYRSLSLPSYGEVNPLVEYNYGASAYVTTNNPLLKPSTAWNYDLGGSLSSNELGLVTVNLFYKEISDLIYNMANFYIYWPYPVAGAPSDIYDRLPGPGYFDATYLSQVTGAKLVSVGIPMNDPDKAYLRGIEISWQTHLWYLPGVLGGIVLDLNASYMSSRQFYPSFQLKQVGGTPIRPIYNLFYETVPGPLQDQPRATYNAIVGWDYQGFSARFSFRFQQHTVTSIDTQYGLENAYYDDVLLTDISLKQKVIGTLYIFANATNINGHIDNYYFSHPGFVTYASGSLPTSNQTYGWASQLGLTYSY